MGTLPVMKRTWIAGLLLLTGMGAAAAGSLPRGAQVVLSHPDDFAGEARVGTYVSSSWGFATTSYWIEGA